MSRYDILPCLACGSMKHYLDHCDDDEALTRYWKMIEDKEEEEALYNADPNCEHDIVLLWSGYKCAKCPGWFCL